MYTNLGFAEKRPTILTWTISAGRLGNGTRGGDKIWKLPHTPDGAEMDDSPEISQDPCSRIPTAGFVFAKMSDLVFDLSSQRLFGPNAALVLPSNLRISLSF